MTWNFLLLRAANFRNLSKVRDLPMVMMISLAWMCSIACLLGEGKVFILLDILMLSNHVQCHQPTNNSKS
jgi:hypothetical protein